MYTIVQHSGAVFGRKPQFKKGLESARVSKRREAKIREMGGLLFDNYVDAENYVDTEQYKNVTDGLIPEAPGKFAPYRVDGLPLYVPVREDA